MLTKNVSDFCLLLWYFLYPEKNILLFDILLDIWIYWKMLWNIGFWLFAHFLQAFHVFHERIFKNSIFSVTIFKEYLFVRSPLYCGQLRTTWLLFGIKILNPIKMHNMHLALLKNDDFFMIHKFHHINSLRN